MSTVRVQAESSFAFLWLISMLTQGPNEDTGRVLEGEGVSYTPLRTTPLHTEYHRRLYDGRSNRYLDQKLKAELITWLGSCSPSGQKLRSDWMNQLHAEGR
jgi:hypothetical protein